MLTGIGLLLIILASLLEAFCTFSRDAMPQYQPKLMKTRFRWVMEVLWVLLLLGGGVMMLLGALISGIVLFFIAIVAFWLILPLVAHPMLQRRLLPTWEELKKELAPKGFTENNYWRYDWWKVEAKRRKKKSKT